MFKVILVVLLTVVGISLIIGWWFFLRWRRRQRIATAIREWPRTNGFVHFSRVERKTDSDSGDAYVVRVDYVYLVDGKSYERKFETERFLRERDAVEKLPLYARGKEVIVYYNPKKPKDSHCNLEAIAYGVMT